MENFKKENVFLVSPERLLGGSLGCDGCGPTECFRVTHKSSEWAVPVYTHTRERRRKKKKVERMNYRASRCG